MVVGGCVPVQLGFSVLTLGGVVIQRMGVIQIQRWVERSYVFSVCGSNDSQGQTDRWRGWGIFARPEPWSVGTVT